MMCWCGVLSLVCRNAAICVRISWLLFACVLQKCMDVKSMVVCPSVAAWSSRARTVRACHACFAMFVSGAKEMV